MNRGEKINIHDERGELYTAGNQRKLSFPLKYVKNMCSLAHVFGIFRVYMYPGKYFCDFKSSSKKKPRKLYILSKKFGNIINKIRTHIPPPYIFSKLYSPLCSNILTLKGGGVGGANWKYSFNGAPGGGALGGRLLFKTQCGGSGVLVRG